ncbi:hypothetical protein WJX74_006338, partial [Apatococcus lobatus]
VLRKLGHLEPSLQDLNQALALLVAPNSMRAFALEQRGSVRGSLKDFQGAVADFEEAAGIRAAEVLCTGVPGEMFAGLKPSCRGFHCPGGSCRDYGASCKAAEGEGSGAGKAEALL